MFIEVNNNGQKILVNSDSIRKIVPAIGNNSKCHLFLEGETITVDESFNTLIEKLNFKAVDEELLIENSMPIVPRFETTPINMEMVQRSNTRNKYENGQQQTPIKESKDNMEMVKQRKTRNA